MPALASKSLKKQNDLTSIYISYPGYIKYRKMCGLTVPSSWNDKPNDISQQNWDYLKRVYNSVADIDAFTGGVSEAGC